MPGRLREVPRAVNRSAAFQISIADFRLKAAGASALTIAMSNWEPSESVSLELGSIFCRVSGFFLAFFLGHLLGCVLSSSAINPATFPFQAIFITPTRSVFFLVTAPVLSICLLLVVFSSLPRIPIFYAVFAMNTLSAFINAPYDRGPRDYSPNSLHVVLLILLLLLPPVIWRHLQRSRRSRG